MERILVQQKVLAEVNDRRLKADVQALQSDVLLLVSCAKHLCYTLVTVHAVCISV